MGRRHDTFEPLSSSTLYRPHLAETAAAAVHAVCKALIGRLTCTLKPYSAQTASGRGRCCCARCAQVAHGSAPSNPWRQIPQSNNLFLYTTCPRCSWVCFLTSSNPHIPVQQFPQSNNLSLYATCARRSWVCSRIPIYLIQYRTYLAGAAADVHDGCKGLMSRLPETLEPLGSTTLHGSHLVKTALTVHDVCKALIWASCLEHVQVKPCQLLPVSMMLRVCALAHVSAANGMSSSGFYFAINYT